MKKLQRFQPALITKHLFSKYTNPAEINMGECFIWAYSAFLIFQEVDLCDVNCHAFVMHRGKFYDSETLKGTTDWRDLPATRCSTTTAQTWSPSQFKREWRGNQKKYGTTWKAIEDNARKVLEHAQASL